MIVLKTGENELFEAAYFIIRESAVKTGESDMIREADRIVREASLGHEQNPCRRFRPMNFFVGLFAGIAAASLCWLIAILAL